MAAGSTFLAYLARLPVSLPLHLRLICPNRFSQIPDKSLDSTRPRGMSVNVPSPQPEEQSVRENPLEITEEPEELEDDAHHEDEDDHADLPPMRVTPIPRRRRLSTYESSDSILDLEDDEIGGSARPRSVLRSYMGSPVLTRRSASEVIPSNRSV